MSLEISETSLPPAMELAAKARLDLSAYRHTSPQKALDLLPAPFWKGIQREGTTSIVAGESKAKKSWLVMSKTQHALIGKPFLGHEMPPPSSGDSRKALFLDFELPKEVFLFRWIALAGEFGEEERDILFDPDRISIECYRELMMEPRNWIDHSYHRITHYCEPGDAAVVDCLQPILNADANAAEVIRPMISKFQSASTQTGAVVDIVDHYNKGEGRGRNRISGSMAKAAGPDTVITLNSEPPGIVIGFDLRMDPPIDDFHVEFEPYAFRVFSEEELEERQESIKAAQDAKALREIFPDGQWYSVKEISNRIGLTLGGAQKRLNGFKGQCECKKLEGNKFYSYRFANNNRRPEP